MSETKEVKGLPDNGVVTKEEEARQFLMEKDEEEQQQFMGEYRLLCEKFGMRLELQNQLVVRRVR